MKQKVSPKGVAAIVLVLAGVGVLGVFYWKMLLGFGLVTVGLALIMPTASDLDEVLGGPDIPEGEGQE